MKTKKTNTKIILLVLSIIICLSLFACKPDGSRTDGNVNPAEDYIYSEGSKIQIVYPKNDEIAKEMAEKLQIDLLGYTYCRVVLTDDELLEPAEHEIVIGNTNRDISKTAYQRLDRINFDPTEQARYLAYTDGKSVAFMYDEDVFDINLSAIKVRETFVEKYVKKYETLTLNPGVIYSEVTYPLEYQKEIDIAEKEQEWQKVLEDLEDFSNAEEIVKALKQYYKAIATSDVVGWLANLYEVETGAFYYSNSARDTVGYGVDIESTAQAFGFLSASGILSSVCGVDGLPDSMKENLGKWVKGLQDTDGYFYHPQWPRALQESSITRLGRDLSRGKELLSIAGLSPTYKTPDGTEGDGLVFDENGNLVPVYDLQPASFLMVKLGNNNVAAAVSKVVATGSYSGPYYLRDKASFESWLSGYDIKNDSYWVGSEIASAASAIKQRDKQLKDEGADYSFTSILEKWLYDNQNPSTGTWDWNNDPLEGSNGVLKIVDVYNTLGLEFPRPELAIENAINLIYGNLPTTIVCDIYNTWFEIDAIFSNLLKNSDNISNTKTEIQVIRDKLIADAPKLIENTVNKLLGYRKSDGSYSFGIDYSAATSSGMPVAVPYTKEGDVNATVISITGTLSHMCSVLGILQPNIFGKSEYCYFYSIIKNLGSIIKDPIEAPEPITFDHETPGYDSNDVDTNNCTSSGTCTVIKDPRTNKSGNVYLIDSKNNGGDNIIINCSSNLLSTSCFVFETEMMVESGDESAVAQLCLHRAYMLMISIKDGKVYFQDSSSQSSSTAMYRDLGISVNVGEWFNLRVEFYPGTHSTSRAVIFINDTALAISDNYFDATGKKLDGEGVPSTTYNFFDIIAFSSSNVKMMLDDVLVYRTQDIYDSTKYDHTLLKFDIDPPESDELIYDFKDGNIPSDFDCKADENVINVTDKFLLSLGDNTLEIDIPENKRKSGTNVSLFETLINISSGEVGAKLEFSLRENNTAELPLVRLKLIIQESEGVKYATICAASTGNDGKVFENVNIPFNTDTKLRIEYYSDKQSVLIYVNDTLTALTSEVCTNANRYLSGKLKITNDSTKALNITFDNLKVEGIVKSYDAATKPTVDRVLYDFENGLPQEIVTTGSVGIISDTSNKLVLNSDFSSFTIPLNDRGIATTVLTTEFDLYLPEVVQDGTKYGRLYITILDKSANSLLGFFFDIKDGKLCICEQTAKGVYSSVTSIKLTDSMKITIDYFKEEGTTNIYVGGVPVLASSVVYNPGVTEFEASTVKFYYEFGPSNVAFDNIIFETFNKTYKKEQISASTSDDKNEVLTFESNTTSAMPKRLTTSLKTSAAKTYITELVMKQGISKVLGFTSGLGNNDMVIFEANGSSTDRSLNAIVFSADIKIDYVTGNNYQLLFKTPSDRIAYMLLLCRKNGVFYIQDVSGNSENNVPGRIWGMDQKTDVSADEEINLKVEIYSGDAKTVRYKTYVNGELVYISNNYYGKSVENLNAKPNFDISTVSIMTESATAATMYIDNVEFAYKKLTLADDPLNGTLPGHANGDDYTFGTGDYYSKEENSDGRVVYEQFSTIYNKNVDKGLGGINDGTNIVTRPGGIILPDSEGNENYPGIMLSTTSIGNTLLKYTSSGKGEFDKTIFLQPRGGFTAGLNYVFESDVYFSPLAVTQDGVFATFSIETDISDAVSDEATRMKVTMTKDDTAHYTVFGKTVDADKWYNIRIEYNTDTGVVTTYINGEAADTYNFATGIVVKYIGFSMNNNAAKGAFTLFDSTYMGSNGVHTHTYEEVVDEKFLASAATEEAAATYYKSCLCGELSAETFSYGKPILNYTFGEGAYYKANGGIVYENYSSIWNGIGGQNAGDTIITRKDGMVAPDSPPAGRNDVPYISIDVYTDINKMLKYTTALDGGKEYNRTILFQPEAGFETALNYVFETDIFFSAADETMLSDGRVFATFSLETTAVYESTATNRISVTMATEDGKNGYSVFGKFVQADKWCTITIDYDTVTGTVNTLVNGEAGTSYSLPANIKVKYIGFSMNNYMKGAYTLFDSTYIGTYGIHTHTFEEVVDIKYLKSAATTESAAIYNKSCTCGELSEETFTYGDPLAEDYFGKGMYYLANGGLEYTDNSAYWHAKYGYAYGTYNNSNSSPTGYTLYDKSAPYDSGEPIIDNRLNLNLTTDPTNAVNKVLWMHRHNATDRTDLVFTNKKTGLTTGDCLVFETNLMLADTTGIEATDDFKNNKDSYCIYNFYINKTNGDLDGDTGTGTWWSGAVGNIIGCIYAKPDGKDGYTYYLTAVGGEDTSAKGGEIKFGQWCIITFEAYENGIVKMFVNGTYITSKTFKDGGVDIDTSYDSITAEMKWGMTGGSGVYFDNTFVGIVEKEYAAE